MLLSPLVEMGVVLYLMKLKSPSPKDSSFYPLESPLRSCRVILWAYGSHWFIKTFLSFFLYRCAFIHNVHFVRIMYKYIVCNHGNLSNGGMGVVTKMVKVSFLCV